MNSNSKTTYFLGIDWGKSRVGLSLADSETRIAFVYGTIKNDDDFIDKAVEIIKKERVKTVVIGIPSYVNRKDVEYDGEKLGKSLENIIPGIAIEYQNEMFTTLMAHENLIQKGIRNIKTEDDQEAAKIILQEWLDKSPSA